MDMFDERIAFAEELEVDDEASCTTPLRILSPGALSEKKVAAPPIRGII